MYRQSDRKSQSSYKGRYSLPISLEVSEEVRGVQAINVLQLAIRTCIAIAKRHLFDSPAGGETVVVVPMTGEEIVPATKKYSK